MSTEICTPNPSSVWQVPEGFREVYAHATTITNACLPAFVSGQFSIRPDGTLRRYDVDWRSDLGSRFYRTLGVIKK